MTVSSLFYVIVFMFFYTNNMSFIIFQNYSLSGATIQDDDDAECRRCCAFNIPVCPTTLSLTNYFMMLMNYDYLYVHVRLDKNC